MAPSATPGTTASEMYLGLLYPTDQYQVFGYVTNTKTKLVIVTDDVDVKDLDIKSLCKRLHALYVDAVSNPFHVPGEPFRSARFDKAVAKLVSSF